jgi:hypothetical protein
MVVELGRWYWTRDSHHVLTLSNTESNKGLVTVFIMTHPDDTSSKRITHLGRHMFDEEEKGKNMLTNLWKLAAGNNEISMLIVKELFND